MLPCMPKRLVIARHRVDFRKQWNGLLAECRKMGFNPYEGDCVVFVKKDRTQLRALLGDNLGLLLIARRFEGECLKKLAWLFDETSSAYAISPAELTLLLEGASATVQHRVGPWQKKE